MAVAVKTSSGTPSAGSLASPALLSLVGVVYLLACLAIVFKLVPSLWWGAWESMGLGAAQFVGGSLLAIVALAVGVGLLIVGARLLGPNPPPGIRAGVFVGFVGLLLIVLLTRWASIWFEHWAFTGRMINETTGTVMTAAVGLGLLVAGLRLFTRPSTHNWIVVFEQMGWFHAIPYKSNQGQKVRRGTIAGLLLIVGAGIYTLMSHNTLAKGPRDLAIGLPFTGKVAVESFGDAQKFLAELPASAKTQVEIRWPGTDKNGPRTGQVISFQDYRRLVESRLPAGVDREAEPTALLLAVNKQVLGEKMQELLRDSNFFAEGVRNRLETLFNQTPWEGIGDIIPDFYRETETASRSNPAKADELKTAFALPSAVMLVDRYALRKVNDQLAEGENVKVLLKGDSDFKEGEIVSRMKFDEEVDRLKALREKGRDRTLPTYAVLGIATGPMHSASMTLLPSVQFTVPLLLLAGSLWLAWRVVNMPAFADFLIATEAELNKVSWTTQRKLVQDTIVVLITVLLMSVFLFGMDWAWKVLLSSRPIGVLHIPKESSQQNKQLEQKKW